MKATKAEFRYRFWIIGGVFWLAFALYRIDHRNVVGAILGSLSRVTSHSFHSEFAARIVFAIAALIAIAASLLRSWATAYIGASVVHGSAIRSDVLVADGPYRHVRNPLYLGVWLLAVSMSFFANRIGFLLLNVGILVVLYRLILREEFELSGVHPEEYKRFRLVPRFFPSLLPRVAASNRRPRWLQGFLGESMFWTMTVAIIAYAFTLRLLWFYLFLALSFPLSFTINAILKRRAAAQDAGGS